MDHPIWEASSPPPEDWQTEDVDREWQHNGIVSEEVDAFGIKQYVKWADWHRPDNTNTTWDQGLNDMDAELEAWNDMQTEKRVREAKNSLSIKIPLDLGQLWHEDATVELSRGYEEKRRESARTGLQRYANWDNVPKLTDNDSESSEDQHDERRACTNFTQSDPIDKVIYRWHTRRGFADNGPFHRVSMAAVAIEYVAVQAITPTEAVIAPNTSPSEDNTQPRRPIKPLPRRRQMVRSAIVESPEASPAPLSRPSNLKDTWNLVARGAGAAPISFVNEVNSEPYPLGLNGFEYSATACLIVKMRQVAIAKGHRTY
ncbi:predicted protein [Postia placenta Mad-698-R]|nr:predicted protein [Postia placenta Mad-698-R]